mmetsp:Transcript_65072/g.164952  ORF Transcript_65072/g.164952 Transcript_65072/m.164952 type:complete len:108 (-) Transcript_65072:477-800(-)
MGDTLQSALAPDAAAAVGGAWRSGAASAAEEKRAIERSKWTGPARANPGVSRCRSDVGVSCCDAEASDGSCDCSCRCGLSGCSFRSGSTGLCLTTGLLTRGGGADEA